MIKRIFVIVLVFIAIKSNAQQGDTSPYSFYGIGVPKYKGTIENRSMGGISMFADSIHLNLQNPAAYSELGLTVYSLGASHNNYKLNSVTNSSTSRSTSIDYLAIGIPAGKFGFGFGVMPISSASYRLKEKDDAGNQSDFIGSGGLNKVYLAAGFKVNKNIRVGLDVNYNFGNIENKSIYRDVTSQFDTREVTDSNLSSLGLTFGAYYKKMINEKLEMVTSIVSTPSFGMSINSTRELASVLISSDGIESVVRKEQITVPDQKIALPSEVKVGLGVGETRKWFVGAEYGYLDTPEPVNVLVGRDDVSYHALSKYKVGGFYIPDYNSLTNFYKRVVYRAGLRYEETGLKFGEESIDEFGISFGVGVPVGRLFSNINLGLEYGQKGKKEQGLIKEQFFNVSISLSLNDKWFRKIKFN